MIGGSTVIRDHAAEGNVDVGAEAVLHAAVEPGARDFQKPLDEPVAEAGHLGHLLVEVLVGFFQGHAQAHDGGQVLGAGALAALLSAAVHEVVQDHALADIQRAYALGRVELMAGKGEHVDVLLPDVDADVAHGLDRVGVE